MERYIHINFNLIFTHYILVESVGTNKIVNVSPPINFITVMNSSEVLQVTPQSEITTDLSNNTN